MSETKRNAKKAFLGILFECCRVYSRVYREETENRYKGRCPKCAKAISIRVDPSQGTDSRFFKAY